MSNYRLSSIKNAISSPIEWDEDVDCTKKDLEDHIIELENYKKELLSEINLADDWISECQNLIKNK